MLSSWAIELSQWVHPVERLLCRRFQQIIPQAYAGPCVALLREVEAIKRQQRQISLSINVELKRKEMEVYSLRMLIKRCNLLHSKWKRYRKNNYRNIRRPGLVHDGELVEASKLLQLCHLLLRPDKLSLDFLPSKIATKKKKQAIRKTCRLRDYWWARRASTAINWCHHNYLSLDSLDTFETVPTQQLHSPVKRKEASKLFQRQLMCIVDEIRVMMPIMVDVYRARRKVLPRWMKRQLRGFAFCNITVSTNGTLTMFTNVLITKKERSLKCRDFKHLHRQLLTYLGRLFFKYLKVFVNEARCFSGSDSGSLIRQMNEQMSLPPIVIVTIFQSYLKLTLLSFLMRCTKACACEIIKLGD